MTNLAHLQDLFRHFSTLLDVMFLPQGSTTLLNAFDGFATVLARLAALHLPIRGLAALIGVIAELIGLVAELIGRGATRGAAEPR